MSKSLDADLYEDIYGDDNEFLETESGNGTSTAQPDVGVDEEPVSPVKAFILGQTIYFEFGQSVLVIFSASSAAIFIISANPWAGTRRRASEHEDTKRHTGNPHNDRHNGGHRLREEAL
ncbi:hypothetical protein BDN71DRAFT_1204463 [Pleurotus eryngii]|uniref:Uncharacterized protein n=1 Tax=Pleurotus eryngii TaxID=5323 RepID=A0A9P6DD60_PLEER|nr:hypothetical protein BDN71DRAFT_1204463 [Pleurotus eryngii]